MHKLMGGCAENELATENATRESISKQQITCVPDACIWVACREAGVDMGL